MFLVLFSNFSLAWLNSGEIYAVIVQTEKDFDSPSIFMTVLNKYFRIIRALTFTPIIHLFHLSICGSSQHTGLLDKTCLIDKQQPKRNFPVCDQETSLRVKITSYMPIISFNLFVWGFFGTLVYLCSLTSRLLHAKQCPWQDYLHWYLQMDLQL